MSTFTQMTLIRSGSTLATGIPVQIDNVSEMIAAYYNKSNPYDVFEIYVRYTLLPIHRNDMLTDQINIDPLTNKNAQYRVVGNPEVFPDGHTELRVNRFTGSQS